MKIYRPWLDGIRALAVLLVVVSHIGPKSLLSLGPTGVSVFFALSGYLITGLLISEYQRTRDIALKDFYMRRFLRLMPALVLVILICDPAYFATGSKTEIRSSVVALLYVSNYASILKGTFVGGFGHTWSLAVEEHFYLLWPPVLLFLLPRYSLEQIAALVAATCFAIIAWRFGLSRMGAPPLLLYIGSVERFDSILFGAVAALLSAAGMKARSWWVWLGVASLIPSAMVSEAKGYVVFSYSILSMGMSALLFAVDTIDMRNWRRVLSNRFLVRVGVLSYGIYLWHIPLYQLFNRFGLNGVGLSVVAAVASYAAADLSSRFVELPIRQRFRPGGRAPGVPVTSNLSSN